MKIDITGFTEDELIDLNRRIVERLRFLSQARAHNKMLEFKVGARGHEEDASCHARQGIHPPKPG